MCWVVVVVVGVVFVVVVVETESSAKLVTELSKPKIMDQSKSISIFLFRTFIILL